MGSIGYIGGNMGYMGNPSMGLDYPYENNPNHYQLWKPPSGYFPRGEAPPPYEEAVAMNTSSCTVSVATTTHRTLPINICPGESNSDLTPSNITTNTTNLINININNAGSITAVAAGENHQINNNSITSNSTPNNQPALMNTGQNQPRSTQTQFNCTSAACMVDNSCGINTGNTSSAICSYVVSSVQEPKPQQLQCSQETLASSAGQICLRSPCNGRPVVAKEIDNSATLVDKVEVRRTESDAEIKAATPILPPPLFDGSKSLTRDYTISGSKTPSTYRRYHRTIPRHFTTADGAKVDKKTCQCPVQHVPMTYMGASHLNSVPQSMFFTGLPTKLISSKPKNKAKLEENSHHHGVISTSLQADNNPMISGTNSLRRGRSPNSKIEPSTTMTSTAASTSSSNKIPTISKYVLSSEMNKTTTEVELHHPNSLPPTPSQSHPRHVQSILKNTSTPAGKPTQVHTKEVTMDQPPFPIQLIDTMSSAAVQEPNPVLPPKMNRTNQRYHHNGGSQKIQTISKSSNNSTAHYVPRMIPFHGNSSNQQHYKSLPRNEEALKNMQAFAMAAEARISEKSHSMHKINTSSPMNMPICGFPQTINHVSYSLPKTSTANSCGKTITRCSISEVVSKVPSVINIPSPTANPGMVTQLNHHPSQRHHQIAKSNNTIHRGEEKPLPVCTTSKNCSNPKEHFLPNDTSLDDDYLSECENCKSAHGSRYYLDAETEESPQETMTLQRKMPDNEEEQPYYRASLTLPTNTKQKSASLKNSRETWFSSIPGSSSSDDEACE
ncbi:hypothetical protein DMENIID0001_142530 [Sergentomyia squamirostris]